MRAASLCMGIGGLDLALANLGHETAWCAEIDPDASKVITARFDIPNHGDIKAADWSTVEPVDILTAGYPCQPFSTAGKRQGANDVRHLWPAVRRAIADLRPRVALLENVRGHLTLGFAEVLADLAALGFDAEWGVLGSHDVGGCHRRNRLWILATAANRGPVGAPTLTVAGRGGSVVARLDDEAARRGVDLLPTPTASLGDGRGMPSATVAGDRFDSGRRNVDDAVALLPTPTVNDSRGGRNATSARSKGDASTHHDGTTLTDVAHSVDFGRYQGAVDRWAAIFGPPPAPTDAKGRLHPPFVEWMMGFPAGWVTDLGLSRTAQLRCLGNAVQPQAAAVAFAALSERLTVRTADDLSRVDLWEALDDFDRAEHRPPTAVELSAALGITGRHIAELRDITKGRP